MLGKQRRHTSQRPVNPLEVVIAGGGVGALEAALALYRLAGDRVKLTLLAPGAQFSYQPMAVLEPFVRRAPRTLPLERFAGELGMTFVQDTVVAVESERGVLHTGSDRLLSYDALVVAVGARAVPFLPGAINVDIPGTYDSLRGLLEEIDAGAVASVAFLAPAPTWPLPVYELALLVREHAGEHDRDLELTIVTAEPRPLDVFGDAVSGAIAQALGAAGIETVCGAQASSAPGGLALTPGGTPQSYDRVVALPRLQGPAIAGLPVDADGFLPVSGLGEIVGVQRVFAVGDATDFPVKYGAIAAQQADAAAAMIAAAAGAPVAPTPFDGTVHGYVLRGRSLPRLHFSARIEGGVAHESRAGEEPLHEDAKIAARYLGPYLDELWASGARWLSGPWSGADLPGAAPR